MKTSLTTIAAIALLHSTLSAANIAIVNHSFEDTTGQNPYFEFTFGRPTGWTIYDPNDIHPSSGLAIGTLMPNGTDFFNSTAPDGDRVAILYNRTRRGDGEYGYEQTLVTTLQSETFYTLTVEVGNIASGADTNGSNYNLNGFPGYRVELLAGGTVISVDNNSLIIPEGEFALSTVSFTTGATHALLGQNLSIRLVSENVIDPIDTDAYLEVDFDDVQLSTAAAPVPEPSSTLLIGLGGLAMIFRRRD